MAVLTPKSGIGKHNGRDTPKWGIGKHNDCANSEMGYWKAQ